MGSGDIGQQATTAATGIEKPGAAQGREHRGIKAPPLALAQHGTVPVEAQPIQVRQDRRLGAGAVAGLVEVVDAQQPLPPLEAGHQPAQQRRPQVAVV
jgi:hypothetical protein